MAENNWIKLDRSIRDHWLWSGEKFSRGQAFVDLLLTAAYADHKVMSQGRMIELKRGSLLTSIRCLADRWLWSKAKVSDFLDCLVEDNIICKQSDTKRTIITIVNYGKYQGSNGSGADTERTQNGHRADTKRTQNGQTKESKEEKESKEGKRKNIKCDDANAVFEILWKLYPCKKGKGQISDRAKMKIMEVGIDEMSRAIERYKSELDKDSDWRKPQNGSTFFNSGYVDYLDDNYVPQERPRKPSSRNAANNFDQREYDYDELENILSSTPGTRKGGD